jgi:hypothetical protein
VSAHSISRRGVAAGLALAVSVASLLFAGSCGRTKGDDRLVLREDIYGFFLGQTRSSVFKRAKGIAEITKAPEPRLGYGGELWNFSAPLEPASEVDHVRCAFLRNRLMEIVVYYRDTGQRNLDLLKFRLEGQYQTRAVADDSKVEVARKTYRLTGPGMTIMLRRQSASGKTDLYIQYLHDELYKELIEKSKDLDRR